MRRAAKIDGTQRDIVEALRIVGATVQSLASVGKGCPDLAVAYRGRTRLLEVKSPGGTLTEAEERFIAGWQDDVAVVSSTEDALRAIGLDARKL